MIHYLSLRDVAARSGLTVNTIKGYARKGLLPLHDVTIGTHRGWSEETIDEWIESRHTTPNPPATPNTTRHLPLG